MAMIMTMAIKVAVCTAIHQAQLSDNCDKYDRNKFGQSQKLTLTKPYIRATISPENHRISIRNTYPSGNYPVSRIKGLTDNGFQPGPYSTCPKHSQITD